VGISRLWFGDLALQGIKITDDESTNRWYLEETIKKKEEQVNE